MVDRYRNYQPRRPLQPAPRTHHYKRWLAVFFIAALIIGGKSVISKLESKQSHTNASSVPKPKTKVKADPIASSTWNELNHNVTALIKTHPELDISVAVIDVNTNTKANYGVQDNFAGASTTKVLTAITYLRQVELGNESLTKTINGTPVKKQLQLMINQSDNNAWEALNNELSYTAIETYAHSLGLSSYSAKGNTITASDEALLLQKLYSGELINDTNRRLLLSYMQHTNDDAMIPAITPPGATVYHKYGQLEDRLHDAAIIDYKDRPIVIVIYTKGGATDGSNYTPRVKLVQQLAQSVFDTIYK